MMNLHYHTHTSTPLNPSVANAAPLLLLLLGHPAFCLEGDLTGFLPVISTTIDKFARWWKCAWRSCNCDNHRLATVPSTYTLLKQPHTMTFLLLQKIACNISSPMSRRS